MKETKSEAGRRAYFEERISYLEEANRNYAAILDMLASSEGFQAEINSGKSIDSIFQATLSQLKRLFPFQAMGILENLEDNSFALAACEPSYCRNELSTDIEELITDGNFAWAINRNQAVIVPSASGKSYLLLHVIATQARIRGMFVGRFSNQKETIDRPSLNSITITLRTTAHAMESSILYAMLSEHLQKLECAVLERTKELEATTLELKESNEKLKTLSDTDSLTGIYNRRYLMKNLKWEIEMAKEKQECVSLIILDIDHFKKINDTYGHQKGDTVIKTIASTCQKKMRFHDILARYGGEEFIIVLPRTSLSGSLAIAERLRESIQAINFPAPMDMLQVTASFGVATFPTETVDGINSLIRLADKALYEAKHSGRNRVETTEMNYFK